MSLPALLAGLGGFVVLAWLCCRLALVYARKRQLIDLPGERRSHQVATPRGGGAGIVAALLLAMLGGAAWLPQWRLELLTVGAALALVAGIGWWDDHRPLPASVRLCVHVIAGGLLGWLAWRDGAGWPWSLLVVGLTAALVNIWNFMDGINGLAVSQAALVAAALAWWLPPDVALAGWLVVLACLVFLPFNFPRARIFLGDVGSGALGLLMAALAVLALRRGADVNPIFLLWPMSVFLIDAGFTLLSRIWTGQHWTQAHTEHLYQWYAKTGSTHWRITLAYAAVTVVVCAMAWVLAAQAGWLGVVISTVLWVTGALVWKALRSSLQQRRT